MESSKTEQERLQMFFDGELSSEEAEAVRRQLEDSPEGAAELAAWQAIRDGIREVSDPWPDAVDSDELFARIEADIRAPAVERNSRESMPALRVVPGGRERRVWGGVAAGLAAAAAILLAVLTLPEEGTTPGMVRGSKVVAVDFGEYAGTVFEVEGGAGQPLSVVWISDEEVAIP
ncbi:MAG: hypothetical protein AAF436_04780 [Myxococcota bacterium]